MKNLIMLLAVVGMLTGSAWIAFAEGDNTAKTNNTGAAAATEAPAAKAAGPLATKTLDQKASYAIGLSIAKTMKQDGLELDTDLLVAGLRDGLTGKKPKMTQMEIAQTMQAFQQKMMMAQMKKQQEATTKNQTEGKKFLALNGKTDGVKTLPSGLQYKVITKGAGQTPKFTDTVTTHYEGRLIDGTVFDSSYKRGQPASFPVNGVIKGWTEALQLMKIGDKWELYIPSDLAYGERGSAPRIGPNATLIFTIELLKIK